MVVESQEQTAALPLLNYNNRKRDSNSFKWDEDDFTDLLGCVYYWGDKIFLDYFPSVLYLLFVYSIFSLIMYIRSKIVPEDSSAMLVPDRMYKENRANWNANYQQPDNLKHGTVNWSLPAWKEPSSRMWNQSNQMKNLRKVSAKQHYLSVARYVAGQSTNLPSRYKKFRHIAETILIACAIPIVILIISCIGQNRLSGFLMNLFEFAPFVKYRAVYASQIYYAIIRRSIYTLINIVQCWPAAFWRISFLFDIFLSISEFIEAIYRVSWININSTCISSYLLQILLIRFVKYFVKYFAIITNLLDRSLRSLLLCVMHTLRCNMTTIILIIEFFATCLSRSLDGGKRVLNGTIFSNAN